MRNINFLHTNKMTTKQWTISDWPVSFKTYFGCRRPQLLHVFPSNAMLKFLKYSKISERDLKSSLQVAAHFISWIQSERLFFLHHWALKLADKST